MLSYDVINKILDYISHLNDAQFRMNVDYNGGISFRINVWFSGYLHINQVNIFKQGVSARPVRLRLTIGDVSEEVDAIEAPRRICDQESDDADYLQGFINDARCYTYSDPSTGEALCAYVICRRYFVDKYTDFRYGEVYSANGETCRPVVGFGSDARGSVHLTVSSMNIWWEIDHAGDMDAAQALLELGEDAEEYEEDLEEIDFDNLPQLQMYM